MTTRLHINVNDETAIVLRELAEKKCITVTELVRRATSVYTFWADEVESGHRRAILEDENGRRTEVLPVL